MSGLIRRAGVVTRWCLKPYIEQFRKLEQSGILALESIRPSHEIKLLTQARKFFILFFIAGRIAACVVVFSFFHFLRDIACERLYQRLPSNSSVGHRNT